MNALSFEVDPQPISNMATAAIVSFIRFPEQKQDPRHSSSQMRMRWQSRARYDCFKLRMEIFPGDKLNGWNLHSVMDSRGIRVKWSREIKTKPSCEKVLPHPLWTSTGVVHYWHSLLLGSSGTEVFSVTRWCILLPSERWVAKN